MLKNAFRKVLCFLLLAGFICALPQRGAASEPPVHILLIGHDRRPDSGPGSRADSIILCSYLPESRSLVMTSMLRDMYLPIPGHGGDRLNAAYALGGRKLLKQTVQDNFGVPLDGSVEVDFSQFAELIDALGGVTLTLRGDEAAHINKCFQQDSLCEGSQLLTGTQALCYCRIRSLDPDGDFSRTRRQQAVLQALLRSLRDAKPVTLMKTVHRLLPMVSTDLDPARILHWALSAGEDMKQLQIKSLQLPAPGTFSDETIRGMQVLVPDIGANRSRLQAVLGE